MDVVVISFDGQIDDFPILVQSVDNLITDGTRHMVIDLHTLPFINSAALGYLIKAQKSMEREGGEMALARVQPAIQNILEMTALDQVFPTFEDVDEAVAYLGGDTSEATAEGKRSVRRHEWR
ncbi:MAG: STAS domain-containing protein [Planctomycetota bacterium]|nr:STAS domain-containing protein [Planctomycetota bacterium]